MVVGQDNPSKFINLSRQLGIEKNVQFFGGRDDVPALMAATDLFLHPAYTENTGTVILEALVAGLPIVVTEICGYSNYVANAACGVVIPEPYNQTNYNQAMLDLLSKQELRVRLSSNAKVFADTQDLYSMPARAADVILSC